jgi:microcystin-dependent protein
MPIFSQITTNAGLSAFAATGAGQQLVITRVAVGNGVQANPATASGLANEIIHAITIAGQAVTTVGNLEISVIVSNTGLGSGFNLSEYGVFGTSGGGAEQLLVYISDSAPIPVPPQSSGTLNIYEYFGLAFANTDNVTVLVASGAYALQAEFVTHLADPAAHPQAFVNPFNLSTFSKQGLIRALNNIPTNFLGGDGNWQALPPTFTVPSGMMSDYAGAVPPSGWLICDGSAISRAAFGNLFAIIGTTYGAGNGSTTYNLPDCRGRTTIGFGQGPGLTNRGLGGAGGAEAHSITVAELPPHNHQVSDPGHGHNINDPHHSHSITDNGHNHAYILANTLPQNGPGVSNTHDQQPPYYNNVAGFTETSRTNIGIVAAATGIGIIASGTGIGTLNTGSGAAMSLMQPFLTINKIIKT